MYWVDEISLTVPRLYPPSYVNPRSFSRRGGLDVVSHKRRRLEDSGAAEGVRGADKDKRIEEPEKENEALRGEYIQCSSQLYRNRPSSVLYGLVANQRKICGSDQSKVEFSKRKSVFSMCFLVLGVPFHSLYILDAADRVIYQDLKW